MVCKLSKYFLGLFIRSTWLEAVILLYFDLFSLNITFVYDSKKKTQKTKTFKVIIKSLKSLYYYTDIYCVDR